VTLLAFATDRHAAVRRAVTSPVLGAQQQTRRTLLQRSTDTTDGRTPDRYIYPASLSMRAASESKTANVGVITIAACTARNPHSRVVSFAVKWLMVNGDDLIVMID